MKKFEFSFSCRWASKANAAMEECKDIMPGYEYDLHQTDTNAWVLEVDEMDYLYDEEARAAFDCLMDSICTTLELAGIPRDEFEISEN